MSGERDRFTVASVYEGDVRVPLRAAWRGQPPQDLPTLVVLDGAVLAPRLAPGVVQAGTPYTAALTEAWWGRSVDRTRCEEMLDVMFKELEADGRKLGLRLVDVGLLFKPIESVLEGMEAGQPLGVEISRGAGKAKPTKDL